LDNRYTLDGKTERVSRTISKLKIDKVLLAQKYMELVKTGAIALSKKSEDQIQGLLMQISQGIILRPKFIEDLTE